MVSYEIEQAPTYEKSHSAFSVLFLSLSGHMNRLKAVLHLIYFRLYSDFNVTPSSRSHEWDYWSSSGDMFIYPANGVGGYHDNFIDTFFDWLLHLIERLGQGATSELLFRGSDEPPPINVTTNPGDAIEPSAVVTDGVEESGAMPIPSPLAQAKPPPAKSGASSSLHPQLLTIRYIDNILH